MVPPTVADSWTNNVALLHNGYPLDEGVAVKFVCVPDVAPKTAVVVVVLVAVWEIVSDVPESAVTTVDAGTGVPVAVTVMPTQTPGNPPVLVTRELFALNCTFDSVVLQPKSTRSDDSLALAFCDMVTVVVPTAVTVVPDGTPAPSTGIPTWTLASAVEEVTLAVVEPDVRLTPVTAT